MATEQALLNLVDEFLARVPSLAKPERFSFNLKDLRQTASWKLWSDRCGIYYVLRGSGVLTYIGKAAPGPLGPEVGRQTAPAEGAWGGVVNDSDAKVGILAFQDSDWYWPLSLEAFLIDATRPEFNHRIG